MSDMSKTINVKITYDSTTSDDKKTKRIVLNSFLRVYPLFRNNNSAISISRADLAELCDIINDPPKLVLREAILDGIITGFMTNLTLFKKFFTRCKIKSTSGYTQRKTRIYLHKVYRLAPVFHYKRAIKNLTLLHRLFSRENFYPTVSTQLALVIYITDELDESTAKKIMQKNIRYICGCSAYAFHNAKNLLEIDRLIGKKV